MWNLRNDVSGEEWWELYTKKIQIQLEESDQHQCYLIHALWFHRWRRHFQSEGHFWMVGTCWWATLNGRAKKIHEHRGAVAISKTNHPYGHSWKSKRTDHTGWSIYRFQVEVDHRCKNYLSCMKWPEHFPLSKWETMYQNFQFYWHCILAFPSALMAESIQQCDPLEDCNMGWYLEHLRTHLDPSKTK